MVLALYLNAEYAGRWADSSSPFEKHSLKQIRIMRNGEPFVDYNTASITQVY